MKKHLSKRLLSLVLAVVMCVSLGLPASAASNAGDVAVTVEKVDNSLVSAAIPGREPADVPEVEAPYADNEVVRVSIVLEKAGTIEAGFAPMGIANNASAVNYRDGLKQEQLTMAQKIEKKTGEALDVVWNLTLAANIISANVKYGQIEAIESIYGVKSVLIETRYEPDVVSTGDADPNMATSGAQTGTSGAWAAGYTGAGSRVAIIDTGIDVDHEAFNAGAFEYSLGEEMADLDLLDVEEIAGVLDQLNIQVAAEDVYISSKIPFGLNYVDLDYNVTHLYDQQGEHGSHVAGIAAANKYVSDGEGGYASALETTYVQGVAPDAQLIIMKVFGRSGGAYDSDYMVAIEDAVVLGADSVNLSLGSGNPGMSRNSTAAYQAILDNLVNSGVVVTMSAGNSGSWVDYSANGIAYMYLDDVSMQTNGSPGSFTNSLAVASVDNDGYTALYFKVGDQIITYAESADGTYPNAPVASIAGEYEYVFLNGIGTPEEFAALGEGALEGKVVLCYRGTTSFFEKANAAASLGAKAVIIVNNVPGEVIYLNLTDYEYTAPVVSITFEDGEYFKTANAITDDSENVLAWTGTMEISGTVAVGQYNSDYYTMSSFSSWGVPGSLQLKPEITAPGGNIYSVNGANAAYGVSGHASYEIMSGTSMAAPQVAGMAAVMAQYIRENGLAEKTGLDERTLSQSLLMSTAVPMLDGASYYGYYYPVLQQGAGLANIGAATTADSYILMGEDATVSYADGKVKAELGDDPDRAGVYSFSFTINNLTDVEKTFALSADMFTQSIISDGYNLYMDRETESLFADVSWTVDGKSVDAGYDLAAYDVNSDGVINTADGQLILDYAAGLVEEISTENADVDGDEDVDTYDAYLFFDMLDTNGALVPAGGSVEVIVTIALTADQMAYLDNYYTSGAYVEGYVFAESLSSAEGVEGTVHSIPVLGFYGNWSDASMYDVGSLPEFWYGLETRYPYLPDGDGYPEMFNNYMTIKYAGDESEYFYFGNPLADDDEYLPERNAFNNENGDSLYKYYFSVIRNAGAAKYLIADVDTGEVYMEADLGQVNSAYFYVNGQTWNNTVWSLTTDWDGTDAEGNKLPEGTSVEISLVLAPEYYANEDGTYNWDALGEGAYLSTMTTIDNTSPVVAEDGISVDLENGIMSVTASDNEYLAVVALYDATGTNDLSYVLPNQTVAGEAQTVELDLTGVVGKTFLLQVIDYALNTTTYKVSYELLPDLDAHYTFYDMGENSWYSYSVDGTESAIMGSSPVEVYAADYVEGYVFAVDSNNDLYVMPDNDFANITFITHLKDDGPLNGEYDFFVSDMAYNHVDETMYFLAYSSYNELNFPYLYTMDLFTGEISMIGEIYADTWTLAIDDEGNFYGQGTFDNTLYKYTIDTWEDPETVCVLADELSIYMAQSSLAWDSENSKLVFTLATASYSTGEVLSADIFLIDPATGEHEKLASHENLYSMVGTYVRNSATSSDRFAPVDSAVSVEVSAKQLEMYTGDAALLSANVLPWNISDKSIVWTSSDPEVATVDENGLVTAVGGGTAVITATSAIDPGVSDNCEVVVRKVEYTLNGVLQDEEGAPMSYTWNLAEDVFWSKVADIDSYIGSAAIANDGDVYVMASDNLITSKINFATGETVASGIASEIPYWDFATSTVFGSAADDLVNGIYASYLFPMQDPMAPSAYGYDLGDALGNYTGASYLVAIESAGLYYDEEDQCYAELIYALDDAGYVWLLEYTANGDLYLFNFYPTDLNLEFNFGDFTYCSMVEADDGSALFLSHFDGGTNVFYILIPYADADGYIAGFSAKELGDVGADVWPAPLTSVTSNIAADDETAVDTANVRIDVMARIEMRQTELQMVKAVVEEKIESNGSLNSVVNYTAPAAPMSDATTGATDATVTVDVTAINSAGEDVGASTNGVVTLTYDTETLTLDDIVVNGEYYAKSVDEVNGVITIAYVSLNGTNKVATVTFTSNSPEVDAILIDHIETGSEDGETYTEEVDIAHVHVNTEIRGTIATSCSAEGYTGDVYCLDCGEMIAEGEPIAAIAHTPVVVNAKAPTFTEPGYSGDTVCSVCGAVLAVGKVLPPVDAETTNPEQPGEPELPFEDVKADDWFYEDVLYVFQNGLMEGVSDTIFAPNNEMSRAMVVTVLYRMEGEPAISGENDFTDLTQDWYIDAVQWAVENGITKGISETEFAPDATVTREQLVTFLYRYAIYKGIDVSSGEDADLLGFSDADVISEYAIPAVKWACAEGILQGSNGVLAPAAGATRAQAAAILHRFLAE